ncbi:hypothetical protein BaRGS_00028727 [Batillaria attramentaria]|uniref:Uncharacterized protein n=1 Tax=Batillaria attramentaria TaxID=370345 RepID=A0ABD0JZ04_9CAEN
MATEFSGHPLLTLSARRLETESPLRKTASSGLDHLFRICHNSDPIGQSQSCECQAITVALCDRACNLRLRLSVSTDECVPGPIRLTCARAGVTVGSVRRTSLRRQ